MTPSLPPSPTPATLAALGVFVVSAWAGSCFASNLLLLELVTATGPLLFFLVQQRPFGSVRPWPPLLTLPPSLLWLCPLGFLAANVFGTRIIEWPGGLACASMVAAFLCVGLAEELTFRGSVFHAFRNTAPAWYLAVSSLLFGALHFQQGFSGIAVSSIAGLGFGLARLARTPLPVLVFCHAFIDFPNALPSEKTVDYPLLAYAAIGFTALLALVYFAIQGHWHRPSPVAADFRRNAP